MTSQLPPSAVERLRDDFHFSCRMMSPERAATVAGRFEAYEQTERAPRAAPRLEA